MTDVLIKEKTEAPETKDDRIRVCFVCTGNTCRSPMAAALLNHLGKGKYLASSAGIMANEGEPISREAVEALRKRGIPSVPGNDYENHKARLFTGGVADGCDVIAAISSSHAMALARAYPFCISRISTLGKDIPDPFMRGQDAYDACLDALEECIKARFLTEEGR